MVTVKGDKMLDLIYEMNPNPLLIFGSRKAISTVEIPLVFPILNFFSISPLSSFEPSETPFVTGRFFGTVLVFFPIPKTGLILLKNLKNLVRILFLYCLFFFFMCLLGNICHCSTFNLSFLLIYLTIWCFNFLNIF
jgi:hypothetical protein